MARQFPKYFTLVFFLPLIAYSDLHARQPNRLEADICIYGGTSAGIIAAYSASRLGKTVILVESGSHLGGLSSGGLGYTDIGNKYVVSGLALDFYRRIGRHYGKFEQWIFEPHVALNIFKEYLGKGKIQLLTGKKIIAANKADLFITDISIMSTAPSADTSPTTITAKMFIDCSYEGDLMAFAGIPYMVGRESNKEFNETYNGVQIANSESHQFPDDVDPYRIPGDRFSGLLWGISPQQLAPDGSADKKVQAYNFRICLTDNLRNQIKITRPDGYDSSRYELLLRNMQKKPWKSLRDGFIWSAMPNRKTDINNMGGFSTDMIGANYEYPEASYEKRQEIIQEHIRYTKGLLYFVGNDPRVALTIRKEMQKWGYPRDEYIHNGHWTPQLYIREARRMIGSYVMTQANCQGKETVSDGVGMAAYTMDSHNCQRVVINGSVKNEGDVEIGGFDPYPISYRSIVPKTEHCKNLLVPVCLSATHIAYGSIRMEPVFMVLAQSSAIAASFAIDEKKPVQEVNVTALRDRLSRDPYLNGSVAEIMVDNQDKEKVAISGEWNAEKNGGYGPDFLVSASATNQSASVTFTPEIQSAGKYSIYLYYPKIKNGSSHTSVIIADGKKSTAKVVSKASVEVEGQTSGTWVSLGVYDLKKGNSASVEVRGAAADGMVAADAVLFKPE